MLDFFYKICMGSYTSSKIDLAYQTGLDFLINQNIKGELMRMSIDKWDSPIQMN